jgi:hypothetical protein
LQTIFCSLLGANVVAPIIKNPTQISSHMPRCKSFNI